MVANWRLARINETDRTRLEKRLERAIARIPVDWDGSDARIDERWSWLKQPSETHLSKKDLYPALVRPENVTEAAFKQALEENFDALKAHIRALGFWTNTLPNAGGCWHFPPREFIKHMQKCGWLSRDEMYQLFPSHALRRVNNNNNGWLNERVIPGNLLRGHLLPLNKACRRYGIVTPGRIACFYANAMQETMWFQLLQEGGAVNANPDLSAWYFPWHGRGFLQSTWPTNYIRYWRFIGRTVAQADVTTLTTAESQVRALRRALEASHPTPAQLTLRNQAAAAGIASPNRYFRDVDANIGNLPTWREELRDTQANARHPADAAGFYWVMANAEPSGDQVPVNARDSCTCTNAQVVVFYTSPGMRRVAGTVNTGVPNSNDVNINGIQARYQAYNNGEMVLMDTVTFPRATGAPQLEPEDYRARRP
jgi:hydroxyethylthiazole kinase